VGFEFFIAKRILNSKNKASGVKNKVLTKPIINIATLGIALSITVMIVSVAILMGFQNEIRDKVAGFGGHLNISVFNDNQSIENSPINKNFEGLSAIRQIPYIKSVSEFATKAGIIKHKADIEGVVLKGVGVDYNWDFFKSKLVSGNVIAFKDTGKSNDILISEQTALKLNYRVGDYLIMFFIQQPPRMRKFKICGIYKTGLEEYDKMYAIGDIKHLKKLNNWSENQTGGYEISLHNFSNLQNAEAAVVNLLPFDLYVQTIKQKEPQIFDWLNLQDINVQIILALMILVAGINMITALLVLILEKTPIIGVLKAMGATHKSVRKIFAIQALYIVGKGMLIGNIIAIGLCLYQDHTHFLKLDQASYYISYVPVYISFWPLFWVNLGTVLICSLMLILPSAVIARISPIKAIRYN
jgi:lipoprotein-releasing system permease protein